MCSNESVNNTTYNDKTRLKPKRSFNPFTAGAAYIRVFIFY